MYVSCIRTRSKFITTQTTVFQCYVRNKVSLIRDKNIIKSPFSDVKFTARTLDEYIWNNIDKWPTKVAMKCGVTGQFYTYEELYKRTQTLAASLRKKLKVENGDCIALMLYNSPDYPIATLGCIAAGCTITTINPVYTGHEVKRQLSMSNAKAIITDDNIFKNIASALDELEKPIARILISNSGSLPRNAINFNEFTEDVHVDKSILNNAARGLDDICSLPYSSGTTGLPKGVELTARNLISNCEQQSTEEIAPARMSVDHQDVVLGVLPFFHIYGFTGILLHKLSIGSKVITLPKFQPATFLNALIKEEISLAYLAPPLVIFLATHPDVTAEHFRSLKTIVSGAAPLAANDCKRILDKAQKKFDILQAYGLTEASPIITFQKLGSTNYASVGVPLASTECKIVCQEKGEALEPNQVGELFARGPQIMKGYRNNPEATADAITPDKWFKTGDLGYYDTNGELYLADRLKELIKVKGYQVPPAELGRTRDHPDIDDAAVIGIPHPTAGETPKAFIVTKEGKNPSAVSIISFVKERVAPYKRLGEVQFTDHIPKNPSGKILRRVLREQK